jgi:hypothetical protein
MWRNVLEYVVNHWTIAIFLPTILLTIAVLATITHVLDSRERRRIGR